MHEWVATGDVCFTRDAHTTRIHRAEVGGFLRKPNLQNAGQSEGEEWSDSNCRLQSRNRNASGELGPGAHIHDRFGQNAAIGATPRRATGLLVAMLQ
jgi:hypothetical protein